MNSWIYGLPGADMLARSDLSCEMFIYLWDTSVSFVSWILCTIALEHVIAISLPHKVAILCTKKNISILLIIYDLGIY